MSFLPVETNKLLLVCVSSQLTAGDHGVGTGSGPAEGVRNRRRLSLSYGTLYVSQVSFKSLFGVLQHQQLSLISTT